MSFAAGLPVSTTFPWLFSQGFGPPGGPPPNNFYPQPNNPYGTAGNFGNQPFGNQPPKKSKFWLIFGIVSGGLVLSCCGCGGVGFYLLHVVVSEVGQATITQYKDHPIVQEHLGTVSKSSLNYSATLDEEDDDDGETTFVYDVEGSKGKGQIVGSDNQPNQADKVIMKNVRLRLPDGREFDLSPEAASPAEMKN